MKLNALESALLEFAKYPHNAQVSLNVACEYYQMGQTASAVSFFLRTAENGYDSDREMVYCSLIMAASCFRWQSGRDTTVRNLILKAIEYAPYRPEAYWWLARDHEEHKEWQEAYTFASVALSMNQDFYPLPLSLDYHADYALFEKAVAGWQIGYKDWAISVFNQLLANKNLNEVYRNACLANLDAIGAPYVPPITVNPLENVIAQYHRYFGKNANFIFDIGTRDGDDADFLGQSLNARRIIAIDANPIAVEKTLVNYPHMEVYETGIGNMNASAPFHQVISDDKEIAGTSSVYAKREPELQALTNLMTIKSQRMDAFLSVLGITGDLDVVKIDIEGLTYEALEGFGHRIHDVLLFHLETELEKMNLTHHPSIEVVAFMESKGFVLVDTAMEWVGIQDQVWVNGVKAGILPVRPNHSA